jgi:hypothetical protein
MLSGLVWESDNVSHFWAGRFWVMFDLFEFLGSLLTVDLRQLI